MGGTDRGHKAEAKSSRGGEQKRDESREAATGGRGKSRGAGEPRGARVDTCNEDKRAEESREHAARASSYSYFDGGVMQSPPRPVTEERQNTTATITAHIT